MLINYNLINKIDKKHMCYKKKSTVKDILLFDIRNTRSDNHLLIKILY